MQGLIGNPYRADHFINELRMSVINVAKTLMEHDIPLAKPKHERTLTDVLQEAAAESAMMLGSNAVAKGVNFVSKVRNDWDKAKNDIPQDAEEIEIFEDLETGEHFYYDDDGNEVICDENGFPLEDDDDGDN
jgi:uncharacterized protein YpuA (DUF1002 family)